MKPRVVFDTNVLFSVVGWKGIPSRCVELAQDERIEAVTCPEILEELAAKLSAKLRWPDERIDSVLASLLTFM